MPWKVVRRDIAARWYIPPLLVDEYPHDEIDLELELSALEAAHQPKQRQQQPPKR